jgi:hypothetical protein
MSVAVSVIPEGMPGPRELRMREHDGRCVITAGPVVLLEYAAGDVVTGNIAPAAARQPGLRGRAVAAVPGLTEDYVAALHNAAKRDGSAALIRRDRRGGSGKAAAAQRAQARARRDQGVAGAETGRRLDVEHYDQPRPGAARAGAGLSRRARAARPAGAPAHRPCSPGLLTGPEAGALTEPGAGGLPPGGGQPGWPLNLRKRLWYTPATVSAVTVIKP